MKKSTRTFLMNVAIGISSILLILTVSTNSFTGQHTQTTTHTHDVAVNGNSRIEGIRQPTAKINTKPKRVTIPEKTKNTLAAIEKFVVIQMIVLGALQMMALKFSREIIKGAHCWLRTPPGNVPSEFITKIAV